VDLIRPDWPAPPNVGAAMTTRSLDVSTGRTDDRRRLREALQLPAEPGWLKQVHGANVVRLTGVGRHSHAADPPEADASYTTDLGTVCVAMAADCLPVLFCDEAGTTVAAAHAGWRGLAAGVLEATVRALPARPAGLMAWMGAAIGPQSFEVGAEVREAFVSRDAGAAACFVPRPAAGKYLADLYGLARRRLTAAGVTRVYGGGLDTLRDPSRFFSFRRDASSGRMAALIWRSE
jgi:purine-nucleoside/S-methyl-5'-thioadenosine phosphorylase / adenosine deaminase